jgi:hypothetical protein
MKEHIIFVHLAVLQIKNLLWQINGVEEMQLGL